MTPATVGEDLRARWLLGLALTLRDYLDALGSGSARVTIVYDGPPPLTVPLWSDHDFILLGPAGTFKVRGFFRGDTSPKYINGITTPEGVDLTEAEVQLVMGASCRDGGGFDWPTCRPGGRP